MYVKRLGRGLCRMTNTHCGHTPADLRPAKQEPRWWTKLNKCNVIKVIMILRIRDNTIHIYIGHASLRPAMQHKHFNPVIGQLQSLGNNLPR